MQDNDGEDDDRDVGLPEVYVLAVATGENDEEQALTAREFMKVQANESYCAKSHFQWDLQC